MLLQITVDSKCKIFKDSTEIAFLEANSVCNLSLKEGKNILRIVSVKYPRITLSREYDVTTDNLGVMCIDSIRIRKLEKALPPFVIIITLLFAYGIVLCYHYAKGYINRDEFFSTSRDKVVDIKPDIIEEKPLKRTQKEDSAKITECLPLIPEDFILIPKGSYSKEEYDEETEREYYVNTTVDSFYICKSELTQGEYARVMGNIEERNYRFIVNTEYPEKYKTFKDDNLPVLGTYLDFATYCNKRSIDEGYQGFYSISGNSIVFNPNGDGYRLLFEDEWVLAALGGTEKSKSKFVGGNNLSEVAWYGGNSGNKPHQVCMKKPNGFGLYDMAGNVMEMLQSTYNEKYRYIAGDSFLHWSYSGREFNDKSIYCYTESSYHSGTRIALIPKK